MRQVVVFNIEEQLLAIELSMVLRVILAVEITLLPNTPLHVLGVINLHGEIVPVIDMRKLFGLKECEIDLENHFIICQLSHQLVALWIDKVIKTTSYREEELISAHAMFPEVKTIDYVVNDGGNIVPIYNLNALLSMTGLNL